MTEAIHRRGPRFRPDLADRWQVRAARRHAEPWELPEYLAVFANEEQE
ncbi:hypothetical protein ACQEV2_39560 [Streptomyces sp. CA-251387]